MLNKELFEKYFELGWTMNNVKFDGIFEVTIDNLDEFDPNVGDYWAGLPVGQVVVRERNVKITTEQKDVVSGIWLKDTETQEEYNVMVSSIKVGEYEYFDVLPKGTLVVPPTKDLEWVGGLFVSELSVLGSTDNVPKVELERVKTLSKKVIERTLPKRRAVVETPVSVVTTVSQQKSSDEVDTLLGCNDVDNAARVLEYCGDEVRYSHQSKQWYIWDGRYWKPDNSEKIMLEAQKALKVIFTEAANSTAADDMKKLGSWAVQSQNSYRINAAVDLAEHQEGIPIRAEELDVSPWKFNVANGTLDLKQGKLFPHEKVDMITKITEVVYDKDAKCPHWIDFMNMITESDQDYVKYLQKIIGYSLTGSVDDHSFFFLYGKGKNGKSTFTKVLQLLSGDYYSQADADDVMLGYKRSNQATPAIARLKGNRIVVASEVGEQKKLNEVQVKNLTGGDTIVARHLYCEPMSFEPTHHLFVYGNHKPTITGDDEGIWRRVRILPFNVTIPDDVVMDMKDVIDMFKEELDGILTWAVQGALLWKEEGLDMPRVIRNAVGDYRTEQDVFQLFLDDMVDMKPSGVISKEDLFKAYKSWCIENNEDMDRTKRWTTSQMKTRDCYDVAHNAKSKELKGACLKSKTVTTEPKQDITGECAF